MPWRCNIAASQATSRQSLTILHRIKRDRRLFSLHHRASSPWLWIPIVTGIAASIRFWQLHRFNALVFDEVYFVEFAQAYRQGTAPSDAHPPLGKYIIATSIQLGTWLKSSAKIASDTELFPFAYRQANAFFGSLIPLAVIAIARTIRQHKRPVQKGSTWQFSILCGLLVAIDNLFVVESRYALLNVHLVLLGLTGHWLWLKATAPFQKQTPVRNRCLRAACGICLGAAIAVKWNALGYLLSLIIWEISTDCNPKKLKHLATLVLTAAIAYSLIWWPHLHIAQENFLTVHANLFQFHHTLSSNGHSACSRWYSWPLLIRPVTYWYSSTESQTYTVSNLGNPAIWLLSASTTLLLTISYIFKVKDRISRSVKPLARHQPVAKDRLKSYLLISYFCNWLPWILIQRCTFNYLYMPAAVFSFMMLAWLLNQWLNSPIKTTRTIAYLLLSLIAIAFLFWLPLALGLPLTPEQLQKRWLLKSWI